MLLYHGTSASRLSSILEDGIRPPGATGCTTNWEHTIESNPHTVYLTDAYGHYFAFQSSSDADKPVILEIDTDVLDPGLDGFLVPDEDALEQGTRGLTADDPKAPDGWPLPPDDIADDMYARTRWYRERAVDLTDYWYGSLLTLGTCGFYGTIPPEAITRVAIFHDTGTAGMVFADAQISVFNYQFCGEHHKNLLRAIFGDWDWIEVTMMSYDPFDPDNKTGMYERVLQGTSIRVLDRQGAEDVVI